MTAETALILGLVWCLGCGALAYANIRTVRNLALEQIRYTEPAVATPGPEPQERTLRLIGFCALVAWGPMRAFGLTDAGVGNALPPFYRFSNLIFQLWHADADDVVYVAQREWPAQHC